MSRRVSISGQPVNFNAPHLKKIPFLPYKIGSLLPTLSGAVHLYFNIVRGADALDAPTVVWMQRASGLVSSITERAWSVISENDIIGL